MIMEKGKIVIIVGHLVPEIKLKYDAIIVIRANLKELIERMEERKYGREKVKENIVSESIDYCGEKSEIVCKNVYEVESKHEKEQAIEYIKSISDGRPNKHPEKRSISKLDELFDLVNEDNKYGL